MTGQPQSLPIADLAGSEIYTTHFHERRILRSTVIVLAAVTAALTFSVVRLANRPLVYRYIRIDDAGRATAITYNDLDYSPREAEIRTFLTDWASLRYSMLRISVAKTYPRNYYFIQDSLASRLMQRDTADRTIARVSAGEGPEYEAQVNNVTFTSLGHEQIGRTPIYSGSAMIDLYKLFGGLPQRREHWTVSVTFYLNPDEISKKSARFPQWEIINPLGLIITDFHEARAAV
jgi:type IV secretion system protein VirB5